MSDIFFNLSYSKFYCITLIVIDSLNIDFGLDLIGIIGEADQIFKKIHQNYNFEL